MKMHDMGMTQKEKYGELSAISPQEQANKKIYVTIDITSDQIPELEGTRAGDKVNLQMEYLVKRITKNSDMEKSKTEYRLELRKAGMISESRKIFNPYKKSE
jgi:hypothetical protein